LEGKMTETPISEAVSTRLQRIAELAREDRQRSFLSLAHHIDIELLREAFRRTRKDGAPGVDGQTAAAYGERLEENLQSLLDRFKSGNLGTPTLFRHAADLSIRIRRVTPRALVFSPRARVAPRRGIVERACGVAAGCGAGRSLLFSIVPGGVRLSPR
jgi:hypothetical protein